MAALLLNLECVLLGSLMHPAGGWRFNNPDSLSLFPENGDLGKFNPANCPKRATYRKG